MAFDMFDEVADSNGFLQKSHMKTICEKYGIKVTSQEADDMFKEADFGKAGKIGFPEFMSMMANRMKMVE